MEFGNFQKKHSFSKFSQKNLKYVRMACQLLEVLVGSDTGKDYLCNSKLIPEIAEQLDLEVLISNQVNFSFSLFSHFLKERRSQKRESPS
jgi:hypothetical protein